MSRSCYGQPQGNPVSQEQQPIKHKYAISFWNSRFTKSLLPSFPFLSGLGTSLLPSRVKNVVNWQWTNVIPLLQTKTADTAHTGIFASVTRPSPQFLGRGLGMRLKHHGGGRGLGHDKKLQPHCTSFGILWQTTLFGKALLSNSSATPPPPPPPQMYVSEICGGVCFQY